jgi:hypothetical protein
MDGKQYTNLLKECFGVRLVRRPRRRWGNYINLNLNDMDIEGVGRVNYQRIFSSASTCTSDFISATRIKNILEVEGGSSCSHLRRTQFGRGYGPLARHITT